MLCNEACRWLLAYNASGFFEPPAPTDLNNIRKLRVVKAGFRRISFFGLHLPESSRAIAYAGWRMLGIVVQKKKELPQAPSKFSDGNASYDCIYASMPIEK